MIHDNGNSLRLALGSGPAYTGESYMPAKCVESLAFGKSASLGLLASSLLTAKLKAMESSSST
jgi:hypothetical protein